VFRALQGDLTHPYADEIHRRVRKKLPRIGLATVYRNLHRLVEDGKIRTVLLDKRVVRYDPETSDHDHFICESCGRVIDLFLGQARRMDLTRLVKDGYIVRTHNLMVYGRCRAVPRDDVRPPSLRARRHEGPSSVRPMVVIDH
jgi:Fur family peroxide stress response transcriptional regulator